jgi:hypothetical protein
VIGISLSDNETPVAGEFFELSQAPWELRASGNSDTPYHPNASWFPLHIFRHAVFCQSAVIASGESCFPADGRGQARQMLDYFGLSSPRSRGTSSERALNWDSWKLQDIA